MNNLRFRIFLLTLQHQKKDFIRFKIMEITSIVCIAIIVAIIGVAHIQNKRDEKESQKKMTEMESVQDKEQQKNELENSKTRDLFLETLSKIGCQYEIDDSDRINFQWQGGYFCADTTNDCLFVNIWYMQWGEWELYDIEELSRVKRIINNACIHFSLNVVYTINEAGSNFFVHSKKNFLFISQIPNREGYLQAILAEFFRVRHYFEVELDKMKNEEEKIQS